MTGINTEPGAIKTGKLAEPCEDKTCFQKFISNGALEQCTVCGQVRDGEIVRRLEAQIKASEAAISRIGESLENLKSTIMLLEKQVPVTVDTTTGNVIIPPAPVEDEPEEEDNEDE